MGQKALCVIHLNGSNHWPVFIFPADLSQPTELHPILMNFVLPGSIIVIAILIVGTIIIIGLCICFCRKPCLHCCYRINPEGSKAVLIDHAIGGLDKVKNKINSAAQVPTTPANTGSGNLPAQTPTTPANTGSDSPPPNRPTTAAGGPSFPGPPSPSENGYPTPVRAQTDSSKPKKWRPSLKGLCCETKREKRARKTYREIKDLLHSAHIDVTASLGATAGSNTVENDYYVKVPLPDVPASNGNKITGQETCL